MKQELLRKQAENPRKANVSSHLHWIRGVTSLEVEGTKESEEHCALMILRATSRHLRGENKQRLPCEDLNLVVVIHTFRLNMYFCS